jgi:hypothetical protein
MIEEPEVFYVNGLDDLTDDIDLEIQQWLETTGIFQIYNGIYADRPINQDDSPLYDLPTQFVNCPRCWEINKGILDVSLLKIQQKDGGTFIFHLGDCSHCKQVIWFRHKLTPKTSEEFIFSPKYISPRITKTARKQNATRKRHRIPVEHSTD